MTASPPTALETGNPGFTTARLRAEPLDPAVAAADVWALLDPERLWAFTGGRTTGQDAFRERCRRLAHNVRRPDELWRAWELRTIDDGAAIGLVEATIVGVLTPCPRGVLAWVVGGAWQQQGYAREATAGLVSWLEQRRVGVLTASIAPHNEASQRVAAGLGMQETTRMVMGERIWRTVLRPECDEA